MSKNNFILITIDGGAATGKSSSARVISERFNYLYADTGSHYRTITYLMITKGINPEDPRDTIECLNKISLETKIKDRKVHVYLDSYNPNDNDLRSQKVNDQVSHFAAMPDVRKFLLKYQRNLASIARIQNFNGMIMEGRDIGSVVFPSAELKLFITADISIRVERRFNELKLNNQSVTKKSVLQNLQKRDFTDKNREHSPLIKEKDAILIDNSKLSIDDQISFIMNYLKKKL